MRWVFALWVILAGAGCRGMDGVWRSEFEHSFVDEDLGYDGWGAVAVADFDGDGRPEFATGGKGGGIYCIFDWQADGTWERIAVTEEFSPNVGGAATDLDGDERYELVCGEWGPRLLWVSRAAGTEEWTVNEVWSGLNDPHDLLAADLDGDGRDEIIVREKGGRLLLFRVPADARERWEAEVLAEGLEGDGTAVARVAGEALDIVTNQGWFENADGNGRRWVRHALVPEELGWHAESRVAVGDVDGDSEAEAVITESEIGPARLAILEYEGSGRPWRAEVILERDLDLRGLHSLELADFDGDGRLEIFTAEMENGKTDGVRSKPKWMLLSRGSGGWKMNAVLDRNLGTHEAAVADFDGDGDLDIVGKVWRNNKVNGCEGRKHADFLRNRRL